MSEKQIIINANASEVRIALLENAQVAEILMQRKEEMQLVGNIYKGTITRVLPGMNSAFVDIGLNKSAFLFGGDVLEFPGEQIQNLDLEDFADHKQITKKPIEKILKDGQQIVVQVIKEAMGTKGPRVTMFLTIPGRYLVLMPHFLHIGISRRIEKDEERERLKSIIEEISFNGSGIIVRTAAQNVEKELLQRDLRYLQRCWEAVDSKIALAVPKTLLFQDIAFVQKVTRDLYNGDLNKIVVDDFEIYQQLKNFLLENIPDAYSKLEFYTQDTPIFDLYGVEIDIARALSKRVELPSGGYLIIEQTEALTSFDVNTGKFVGKSNAAYTILKTNLEAAVKIVEQLRIRNIGGIIILDFIDMESANDREKVFHLFHEELKKDRARSNVLRISELGLIQMTRKRTSDSLERKLLSPCLMCEGRGHLRSTQTEALDLLREILRVYLQTNSKAIKIKVRRDIYEWIQIHEMDLFEQMKLKHLLTIDFIISPQSLEVLRAPAYEVIV